MSTTTVKRRLIDDPENSRLTEWTNFILEIVILVIRVIIIYVNCSINLIFGKRNKCIKDAIVVITGAGHGLGREMALKLAAKGAKIGLIDINSANNSAVEKEILESGHDAVAYTCDVTNEDDVKAVIERIKADLGLVDILINNAGVVQCLPVTELKSKMIEKTFQVNVYAHFWTIRSVLEDMVKKGSGHIVAISSIAGLLGTPNCVDYCASKFAINGLMTALDRELHVQGRNPGIKLTTICPLIMSTGMFQVPKTRFNSIFPVTDAGSVADKVISAVLKEKSLVTIPSSGEWFYRIGMLTPMAVRNVVQDFFDYGVDKHDDGHAKVS